MLKFSFNKLVRDKIVEHQIANGAYPSFRKLDSDEHKRRLVEKMTEEGLEVLTANPEEMASEIADVQQALDDLRELVGVSADQVTKAQAKKNEQNGPFKQGLYLDYVEVDEHDKWVEYYRKNADRYPEIK